MGFDVHRYDPDRRLYLGGVHLEGEVGLAGHSDADVLLHALVDALLGGVSEGDIGTHFPPSDERFRGAPSSRFVEHALGLVRARGAVIDHVDLTVIGERPRMSPYRAAIRARLSELLALRDRKRAGRTAPPYGLFLVRVDYPAELLTAPDAQARPGTSDLRGRAR